MSEVCESVCGVIVNERACMRACVHACVRACECGCVCVCRATDCHDGAVCVGDVAGLSLGNTELCW